MSKLYIGNLPYKFKKEDLKSIFEKFGRITDFYAPKKDDGDYRGFAFITFETNENAQKAVLSLNNTDFNGRNIKVNFATEKPREGKKHTKNENSKTKNERLSIDSKNDNEVEFFIPKDTLEILNNLGHNKVNNFSLKFNKFSRFDEDKFKFFKNPKKKGEKFIKDVKENEFKSLNIQEYVKIFSQIAKTLYPSTHKIIEGKIDWRMVIGLGSESVYETSMTLHPVYGFPYIPGQAVKGMVRSWIIQNYIMDDNDRKDDSKKAGDKIEKKAFQNRTFCKMFGCPKDSILKKEHQGKVIFFDALPISEIKLKVDIMNPHYTEYYSNKDGKNPPPADYYGPTPIPFITVEDTNFQFIIGIKENDNIKIEKDEIGEGKLLDITNKFFEEALQNKGIGAKSAVGYGYFKDVEDKTAEIDENPNPPK